MARSSQSHPPGGSTNGPLAGVDAARAAFYRVHEFWSGHLLGRHSDPYRRATDGTPIGPIVDAALTAYSLAAVLGDAAREDPALAGRLATRAIEILREGDVDDRNADLREPAAPIPAPGRDAGPCRSCRWPAERRAANGQVSLVNAPRFAAAELDSPDGHQEWVCLPSNDADLAPWVMVFGENVGARYDLITMEDLGAVVTFVPVPVRPDSGGDDR